MVRSSLRSRSRNLNKNIFNEPSTQSHNSFQLLYLRFSPLSTLNTLISPSNPSAPPLLPGVPHYNVSSVAAARGAQPHSRPLAPATIERGMSQLHNSSGSTAGPAACIADHRLQQQLNIAVTIAQFELPRKAPFDEDRFTALFLFT